jgi:hypothetical protein
MRQLDPQNGGRLRWPGGRRSIDGCRSIDERTVDGSFHEARETTYCLVGPDDSHEEYMFSLVYVSSAVTPFSVADLTELLSISHRHNAPLGITGMLLYKDGNVMQVLEGDKATVLQLYSKIGRDPRHRNLITILQGPVEHRTFADWSMGFRDLRSMGADRTPGYSEFLNTPLTGQEFSADPTRCQRLLMTFKKSM